MKEGTNVKFKRGVSMYMEFDSTREKSTNKFTKFVLKTHYVKSHNALKTERVQTSTLRYVIKTNKNKTLIKNTYLCKVQYSKGPNYD